MASSRPFADIWRFLVLPTEALPSDGTSRPKENLSKLAAAGWERRILEGVLMVVERLSVLCCACAVAIAIGKPSFADDEPQYAFGDIRIPKASADEPIRQRFSPSQAVKYLDQGATAWSGARKCISCHTTGTYMLVRPGLTQRLGPPPQEMRDQFVRA